MTTDDRQVEQARAENARLRSQFAEVREQRDQAAEALVRVETERDEALCTIAKIAEVLGFPGGDLREAIRALRRERDEALQEAESVGRQLHGSTREVDRLIAQLATVTEERDEARAEIARLERAAHEQGADLWIAEDRLDRLRRQVLAVAEDLERYASDLRPEKLPMSERKLAWTLRQIVAGERPEACRCGKPAGHCSHCHDDPPAQTVAEDRLDWLRKRVRLAMDLLCSPTVPHGKGPDVPGAYGILSHALQTDEQAQVRGESHTEASAGADGPWSDAWCRTQLQRLCIAASEQYGLRWRDYDVVGVVIAEIDRLRTEAAMLRAEREWLADRARTMGIAEAIIAAHGPAHAVSAEAGRLRAKVKHLSARVREWEAVNADLAARCDSGDIPIRLGERYSQAVLREIDRLRELANEASELGITDTDQPASARVDLVIGLRQRGVPQHPDGPEAAALAEIDRLRTILRENGDHRG